MNEPEKKSSIPWGMILLIAAIAGGYWMFGRGGSGPRVGQRPLPFDTAGTWLNTDQPLGWDDLSNRVVWLEFSFLH